MELFIAASGLIRALYSEAIPIQTLGRVQIERASHVEPDASANWWADLKPRNGPLLGPFTHRSQALQAEHDWLTQHVLSGPTSIPMKARSDHETPPPQEVSLYSDAPATTDSL